MDVPVVRERLDRIRREAFEEGEFAVLEEAMADDYVLHSGEGETFHGPDGFERYVRGIRQGMPDITVALEDLIVGEDAVVERVRAHGTHEGEFYGIEQTGADVETTATIIHYVDDGEIRESVVEINILDQLQQLEVLNDWQIQLEYLMVLNRVLRHNVRNDVGAMMGYAEALAGGEGDADELIETIRTVGDGLVELAEKARALERHALGKPIELREIDVESAVRAVVDEHERAGSEGDVSVGGPEETVTLSTDLELLATVLSELLDNAVDHHDGADPRVAVTVTVPETEQREVEVRVADDGPGIPDHETVPILREAEDPLVHGSGVGLWTVKWCVERLDGELGFEDNEPRGSVVTVRLPHLDERD